jgi:flagellar hook assembly protein FlgD
LRIYNVAGRLVRTLVSGELAAGAYQRVWDGRDESGSLVGSGVYFYRLATVAGTRAQRAVFVR